MDGADGSAVLPPPLPAVAGGRWPMPVAQFLSGPYLQRADVVLTRKHRDLRSWFIRWATRSQFSHAAMVFLTPHHEQGFDNTFVIEAASEGVDITDLRHFLDDRRALVGIKRLPGRWFTPSIQSRVRGRMLNSIKCRYSYGRVLDIAFQLVNNVGYGLRNRVAGERRAISGRRKLLLQPPNEFICSGLVQLGFLHTIVELAGQGELSPARIADVMFCDDLSQFLPTDWDQFTNAEQYEIMWDFTSGFQAELEALTPEHLARTPALQWVYVVRDGMVVPVTDQSEVPDLLDWQPARSGLST